MTSFAVHPGASVPYKLWSQAYFARLVCQLQDSGYQVLWVGAGVLLGTLSWSISLNIIIHLIRHKISAKAMRRLNLIGGIILLGFSILGLMHSGVLHVT